MTLFLLLGLGVLGWYLWQRSQRKTHSVPEGLQTHITLPHTQTWTLYHNDFSLCSKKVRVCLAELDINYDSCHIDLIETGKYENIRHDFLRVNPGGVVPVLLHDGHPIYESHEQIKYAASFGTTPGTPNALVPTDANELALMHKWIEKTSLVGDNPMANMHKTAGNAIPGLTVPLFAAMIEYIPWRKIFEGLLFHRFKQRAVFFISLKFKGLRGVTKLPPVTKAVTASFAAMQQHLADLESQLHNSSGPWIVGSQFTLADVGMMVILDRLREGDWIDRLLSSSVPNVSAYWTALQQRSSYTTGCLEHQHPRVLKATIDIQALNQQQPEFWAIP